MAGSQDVGSLSAGDGPVSATGKRWSWQLKGRRSGSKQMESTWWVLVAFWAGGCAGVLVMALMHMARGLPKQSVPASSLKEVPH
jgi:hypothetical protein